ncbi:MAG TPA: glycosyltransferase [Acidobacteriaceae bacterium]|nr:glycosyltransferase [Acidobacteriaceae bacterium]
MRVLLVSGSYPPDACGVGDYTCRLAEALRSEGVSVDLLKQNSWRLRDGRAVLRAVDDAKADIVHLQYPSVGYGRALGPQLLSCRRPCVVTVHEITQAHPVRKLSLYGFLGTAKTLIFTSHFERRAALKLAPWIEKKSAVIPIGSNVPVSACRRGAAPNTIGYFGLIRPNKGLEQVLELARLSIANPSKFKVLIIGSQFGGQESYYRSLRQQSAGLPVEWRVGLNGPELNAALCECEVAYLPFPDGASERRSSLLAFMNLGTPVITTRGPQVTENMERAVSFAANPEEALRQAGILMTDCDARGDLRAQSLAYARTFHWDMIAQQHIQLYRQISPTLSFA